MTQIYDIRQTLAKTNDALLRGKSKVAEKKENIRELVKNQKISLEKRQLLEKENLGMKKTIHSFETRFTPDQEPTKTIANLDQKIKELKSKVKLQDEEIRIKKREKRALEIEVFSAKKDKKLFEDQMQALIDRFDAFNIKESPRHLSCPVADCSSKNCIKKKCPQYRLCAKRVFMIGGITKMKPYYKNIVEKAGGRFDYHDGYLKNSAVNLEARVKRSDLVICPVNCNSHNACLKVKKLCNAHNKQLKILGSSSLSAITHALFKQEHEIILN